MTVLTFEPQDLPPAPDPDDVTAEYTCKDCGRALAYNGRGRKPVRCSDRNGGDPECYGSRKSASTGGRKAVGNDRLAEQAASVLYGLNAMIGTGAFMFGFAGTASAIARANDSFESRAIEALKMDPGMCRMILRGGASGGKLALVMAYAMFASNVVPIAAGELRARREAMAAEGDRAE